MISEQKKEILYHVLTVERNLHDFFKNNKAIDDDISGKELEKDINIVSIIKLLCDIPELEESESYCDDWISDIIFDYAEREIDFKNAYKYLTLEVST